MFWPYHLVFLCVCVCVCLSVITFVTRWLDLAAWCQVRSILSTRTWKCNISQDNPFPFLFYMDHPYKITFWPITSKTYVRIYTKFCLHVDQLGGQHICGECGEWREQTHHSGTPRMCTEALCLRNVWMPSSCCLYIGIYILTMTKLSTCMPLNIQEECCLSMPLLNEYDT